MCVTSPLRTDNIVTTQLKIGSTNHCLPWARGWYLKNFTKFIMTPPQILYTLLCPSFRLKCLLIPEQIPLPSPLKWHGWFAPDYKELFGFMEASLPSVVSCVGVTGGRPGVRLGTHWKQRIIPYEELDTVAWETGMWNTPLRVLPLSPDSKKGIVGWMDGTQISSLRHLSTFRHLWHLLTNHLITVNYLLKAANIF